MKRRADEEETENTKKKNIIVNEDDRDIFFSDVVDEETMHIIISNIVKFNKEDDDEKKILIKTVRTPISIYINSPGGCLYSCLGLVDIIKTSKTTVNTYITGLAASAAGVIFMAGHNRFMSNYGTLLYHNVTSTIDGSFHDFDIESKEIKRLQKIIDKLYLENSTLTQERLDIWKNKKTDMYIDYRMAKRWKMITDV